MVGHLEGTEKMMTLMRIKVKEEKPVALVASMPCPPGTDEKRMKVKKTVRV